MPSVKKQKYTSLSIEPGIIFEGASPDCEEDTSAIDSGVINGVNTAEVLREKKFGYLVEVEAPATLPDGYNLDIVLNGEDYVVTVSSGQPQVGLVQAGQKFRGYAKKKGAEGDWKVRLSVHHCCRRTITQGSYIFVVLEWNIMLLYHVCHQMPCG